MGPLRPICLFAIAAVCSVLVATIYDISSCSADTDKSLELQRTIDGVLSRHPELATNKLLMDKMISIVTHYERFGNTRNQSILRAESDMIRNGILLSEETRQSRIRNRSAIERKEQEFAPSGVIESRVEGDFNGWEGETVVRLSNGQIWVQEQYHYEYRYAYMPKAIVFISDGRWKMLVDGTSKAVPVSRIK